MNHALSTFKQVLTRRGNLVTLLVLSALLFAMFLLVPVWTIPGNTLAFQISIYLPRDYVLTGFLAGVTGLFLVLQTDLFRQHRGLRAKLGLVGKGGAGSAAGILAAILGTAACASCVAVLLGFLGIGTVFALIRYRWFVVVGAIVLMLISIGLTLKHLAGRCPQCEMRPQPLPR